MNFVQKFTIVLFCFLPLTMQAMMPVPRPVMPVSRAELGLALVAGATGAFFLRQAYITFMNWCRTHRTTVHYDNGTKRVFYNLTKSQHEAHVFGENVRSVSSVSGAPGGWSFVRATGLTSLYGFLGTCGIGYALVILLQLRLAGLAR